jgi:methyl-accepting chemotaxis protein
MKVTVTQKVLGLAFVNLLLTCVIAGVGYWAIQQLVTTQDAILTSDRALANHLEGDMMHDALRADVFSAFLHHSLGESAVGSTKQIQQDTEEHSKHFQEMIEQNLQLPLPKNVRDALMKSQGALENYIKAAREIVPAALREDPAVSDLLPKFLQAFSTLEESNEQLGEFISAESEKSKNKGMQTATWSSALVFTAVLIAVGVGVLISLILSASITRPLRKAISSLHSGASTVGRMNSDLEKLAHNLAASVHEQSAAVQESVASMSEMSSMISQTADSARRSLSVAQSVSDRTNEGNQTMEKMVLSMASIQEANDKLQDMAAIIKEISSKTAVINDIVFKTQLLAFNASIEAARAGQHGRGFAVVAEEVGNLAEVSGVAAKEIQALLMNSERQVATIVEDTRERVSEGREVSQDAMTTFAEIAKAIHTISSQMQSITDATREQELGVQQTTTAMRQMDIATQQNSDAASRASLAVAELGHQTTQIREIVDTLTSMTTGSAAESDVHGGIGGRAPKSLMVKKAKTPDESANSVSARSATGVIEGIVAKAKQSNLSAPQSQAPDADTISADSDVFRPMAH